MRNYIWFGGLFTLIIIACNKKNEPIFCTEEFRSIIITVNEVVLEEHFTLRNSTGDTLRFEEDAFWEGTSYTVLNDLFKDTLRNRQENFTFYGIINDIVVVEEPFVIKADECHIELVSGRTEITL
jgi:hypothetical protein